MALKTKVKVGTITNLSDARYCAGMGVDYLGFAIGGKNGITLEKFKEINGWITGPELVLELSSPDLLAQANDSFFGHYIQVNAEWLAELKEHSSTPLVVAIELAAFDRFLPALEERKNQIKFLLVRNFDFNQRALLDKAVEEFSVLIQVQGISSELDNLLQLPIEGIAMEGSDELRPGLKDYQHLSDVLEKLEAD